MSPWLRWPARLGLLLALLLLGPFGVMAFGGVDLDTHWQRARSDSVGLAPDPARVPEAVVQVYGARTVRWRGAFGIHPWIAIKRAGEPHYTVYQVIGWRVRYGGDALAISQTAQPDLRWFGAEPDLLADVRGDAAQALVERIEAAALAYPWRDRYGLWPGPNSNTFVAHVARAVPELGLDLPPTAIGKDYLGGTQVLARAPSGSGWQVSLAGLLGVTLARAEGLEINLLGLAFGLDVDDLRLRLPGVGLWPSVPAPLDADRLGALDALPRDAGAPAPARP